MTKKILEMVACVLVGALLGYVVFISINEKSITKFRLCTAYNEGNPNPYAVDECFNDE